MSDNNFKSNLPDDIILNKKYSPIKSDEEKKQASNRSKKNWQDPEYIKKNLERQLEGSQDPSYRASKAKQMKKIASTDEWKETHMASRKKMLEDPLFGQKVSKGLKNALSSPEARAKKKEVSAKNYENPEYVKNRYEGFIKARGTPCVADFKPYPSVKHAGLYFNVVRNFNNGPKWVKGMIEKGQPGFYYITREEYEKIKNEIID